jgi:CRISPR-associated protein Csm4
MAHTAYRATLALHSTLGTPLAGDTLFGQLCWALRDTAGSAELDRRLEGYTSGRPWLVVSDGFPAGYLPKPTLPAAPQAEADPSKRKEHKAKRWVAWENRAAPLPALLAEAVNDADAYGRDGHGGSLAPRSRPQAHNTLDRLSGTTGPGAFAPYTQPTTFHAAGQRIDLHLVLDDERLSAAEARDLLEAVGLMGYGRDASIGLGKFSVQTLEPSPPPVWPETAACWTLAPCAPQGQGFVGERSFWKVLTRFGRHGSTHALAGQPFKTPLLLAATGALLVPGPGIPRRLFVGRGLGGDGRLSKAEPATVNQGYAPALPLILD